MKNTISLLAGIAALVSVQTTAQAATFSPTSGTFTFEGMVDVAKELGPFSCLMTVVATPTSATTGTASASLSGAFPCPNIGISGSGSITPSVDPVTGREYVTVSGLTIKPALSIGQCTGPITVEVFDLSTTPTATPTELHLTNPESNSAPTAGVPCTMVGVLTQTSPGSPQFQVVP